MRLRDLWWDWNPKRLRRLLSMKDGQISANANLAANTHLKLMGADGEIERLRRRIKILEYTLEAKEEAQND